MISTQARRFITFVDACYESKVCYLMSPRGEVEF